MISYLISSNFYFLIFIFFNFFLSTFLFISVTSGASKSQELIISFGNKKQNSHMRFFQTFIWEQTKFSNYLEKTIKHLKSLMISYFIVI